MECAASEGASVPKMVGSCWLRWRLSCILQVGSLWRGWCCSPSFLNSAHNSDLSYYEVCSTCRELSGMKIYSNGFELVLLGLVVSAASVLWGMCGTICTHLTCLFFVGHIHRAGHCKLCGGALNWVGFSYHLCGSQEVWPKTSDQQSNCTIIIPKINVVSCVKNYRKLWTGKKS